MDNKQDVPEEADGRDLDETVGVLILYLDQIVIYLSIYLSIYRSSTVVPHQLLSEAAQDLQSADAIQKSCC